MNCFTYLSADSQLLSSVQLQIKSRKPFICKETYKIPPFSCHKKKAYCDICMLWSDNQHYVLDIKIQLNCPKPLKACWSMLEVNLAEMKSIVYVWSISGISLKLLKTSAFFHICGVASLFVWYRVDVVVVMYACWLLHVWVMQCSGALKCIWSINKTTWV